MIQLPPWLEPLAGLLASGSARCPQALLIHGAPGSGRRLLALTHAARLLGIPAERLTRLAQPGTGEDSHQDNGNRKRLPPEHDFRQADAAFARQLYNHGQGRKAQHSGKANDQRQHPAIMGMVSCSVHDNCE